MTPIEILTAVKHRIAAHHHFDLNDDQYCIAPHVCFVAGYRTDVLGNIPTAYKALSIDRTNIIGLCAGRHGDTPDKELAIQRIDTLIHLLQTGGIPDKGSKITLNLADGTARHFGPDGQVDPPTPKPIVLEESYAYV